MWACGKGYKSQLNSKEKVGYRAESERERERESCVTSRITEERDK